MIGGDGEQLGIYPLSRALEMARTDNLDLVEVSPNAQPPVCRLYDYGKYKYEQTRKEREARKTQKTWTLKEMRLKPKIGEHDLDFKTKLIQNFLVDGDKVKVTVNFRGRENAHPELGRAVLEDVAKRLAEVGSVERMPLLEGRSMTMIMTPVPPKTQRPADDHGRAAADNGRTLPPSDPRGASPQSTPAQPSVVQPAAAQPPRDEPPVSLSPTQ